ncbi:MAG: tRNA glutamyl-Q(34) synthetase GluQRS [Mariprofundus sp.]
MSLITRFAPSPTGFLHVGNAFAALQCQQWAEKHRAKLLLRIEDIDHTRCRQRFADALLTDLHWLGICWHGTVRKQSEQLQSYRSAIKALRKQGVIYPCFCTRKSIDYELTRMAGAPHRDEIIPPYPGICRELSATEQQQRMQQQPFAWRLNVGKAMRIIDKAPTWHDNDGRIYSSPLTHDVVIGRKDIGFSYHLAVVMDDAAQGVTHIIRGMDLQPSTVIHRLLQLLMDLPEPTYIHHPLLTTPAGERLAKRIDSTTLRSLREMGVCPDRLRNYLLNECKHVWPFIPSDEAAIVARLGKQ